MGKTSAQNVVGPIVRKLRYAKGWTQAMLTARCSRLGWDLNESTIAKIEAQFRCVSDRELIYLARALETTIEALFPPKFLSKK
jgi:transcriptional regulator with XRE-family HTH domain